MTTKRQVFKYLIEAEWRIYESPDQAITGSGNALSPVRHQAIIWTNAGLLGTYPREI